MKINQHIYLILAFIFLLNSCGIFSRKSIQNEISKNVLQRDTLYFKAINYARSGDFENAYFETNKLLKHNPYYSPAKLLYACVNDVKQKNISYDLAIYIFNAIILSEDDDKSLNRLIEINKAKEIDSSYYLIYIISGNIYHRNSIFDRSLEEYSKSIALKPNYGLSYLYRGLVYFEQKNYDNAISDFSNTIELSQDYFEAYWFRAVAYYELKQFEKSIIDNNKTIKMNPEFFGAYLLRGDCFLETNQIDASIKDLSKAIKLNTISILSYKTRARAYKIKGLINQEVNDYKKILELDEANWDALFYIAEAYEKLNQKENAKKAYQIFLKTVPSDNKEKIEIAGNRIKLINEAEK